MVVQLAGNKGLHALPWLREPGAKKGFEPTRLREIHLWSAHADGAVLMLRRHGREAVRVEI